MFHLSENSGST